MGGRRLDQRVRRVNPRPGHALRVGVLWTLVPGLCLMVPELDQALALPVAAAVVPVAVALAPDRAGRGLVPLAAGAGALTGVAAFFSYGAPLLVVLGAAAAAAPAARTAEGRRRAALVAAVTAAVTLACFFLPALFGHHPIDSARTALTIHREQFTAHRSYPQWLFFDLLDLTLFLGVPVVLFGLWLPRTPFRLAAGTRSETSGGVSESDAVSAGAQRYVAQRGVLAGVLEPITCRADSSAVHE